MTAHVSNEKPNLMALYKAWHNQVTVIKSEVKIYKLLANILSFNISNPINKLSFIDMTGRLHSFLTACIEIVMDVY